MRRARWIVAAALLGGALTSLTVAALALAAVDASDATVTLRVAVRGSGSLSAAPIGGGDAHPCVLQEGEDDCTWTYERGTSVRLTATTVGSGSSFSGWSEPDCGTGNACTIKVDDDLTSVVAVFSPLMLAVKLSEPGGANVTFAPPGQPCADAPGDADFCRAFAPHTRVDAHAGGRNVGLHALERAARPNYLCEPLASRTCTIAVEDQPTWVGARLRR